MLGSPAEPGYQYIVSNAVVSAECTHLARTGHIMRSWVQVQS